VEAYRYLGAHPKTVDGKEGIAFAVWAPNASRVSVVGDFNSWDGRAHQMNLIPECGIYELFIPGLSVGCTYKYELRLPDGLVYMRPDPYSQVQKKGEISVSAVFESRYSWKDASWKQQVFPLP
jgi:1,4-alpha-glucan branching enzyme